MRRTLLVTNDFPPVVGGIQSYLDDYTRRLPAGDLVVLASTPPAGPRAAAAHDATLPFAVHRAPTQVLLPTPDVRRRTAEIIHNERIETVWFGAAAPLGLLGGAARRAGASRVIATTHGHEVGWSMLPGSRQALKQVFREADVVSYISDYTLGRLRPFMAADQQVLRLPSGIDVERFRPDPVARRALRERYHLGQSPTVVCVSRLVARKGQDSLIQAWPRVVEQVPDAHLVIVGWGSYAKRLALLKRACPVRDSIVLTGAVPAEELPGHVAMGDVFAMPCRTRGGGLDVEGLGIVFLEASACGLPVIAGTSGGAPETVVEGVTGNVVDGLDEDALVGALVTQLSDASLRERMGRAGRRLMEERWTWPALVDSLVAAIDAR
ncbi:MULTISPECIES: glycosyltransferase family 4 protein [unclassified Actinomyces]|uniref:glycosyltransferase family 4 protein n=1 Tax=unclassified Actinomyces TaxID=2609248 RepID=UPI0020181BBD|nr:MULTISPECIES: glycosyltransferase family 4 protein [unclassified Actinomyces]MCL3776678.1 glycosyltransferase family 4 protein [Actinomyces sp. AC-20-1]MCL3789803.1 glycosyltransferase family 4 protein [Actinomyces sp. 187325]MCL3792392.1 glycosyltransferase family 4 protein [Actinomyces sp. 186855]MCL3794602.1 glycosyltransferase family 4 protein [Actinomyces sp. 217892]